MASSRRRRRIVSPGEFDLIATMRQTLGRHGLAPPYGIGDDAAILKPSRHEWLLSTDLLFEHIHFDTALSSYQDIGYRAAAANVSDIAAMGGTPRHLLIALALPPQERRTCVTRLYQGVNALCRRYGITVIGGDTSTSPGPLCITMTIVGSISPGTALRRDRARGGDLLYVTGTLGDSRAGLTLLQQPSLDLLRTLPKSAMRHVIRRHQRPTPRVSIGQLLASRKLATAAIDLSDGLSGDLHHLCQASQVGALIDEARIPLSPACRRFVEATGTSATTCALQGGEDYELLFSTPARKQRQLERLIEQHQLPVTRIGEVRHQRDGVTLRGTSGTYTTLMPQSFDHFGLASR